MTRKEERELEEKLRRGRVAGRGATLRRETFVRALRTAAEAISNAKEATDSDAAEASLSRISEDIAWVLDTYGRPS